MIIANGDLNLGTLGSSAVLFVLLVVLVLYILIQENKNKAILKQ